MRLIFIFGVFILLYCNGCASRKTVVFLFDKVNSTADDQAWLRTRIQSLSAKCDQDGFYFQFKTVFPYESHIVKISNSTTSRNDSTIVASESTLKNLLTQLKQTPSYSAIYVITNATTTSDKTSVDDILEEIQIKRTEVNFLFGSQSFFNDYRTDSMKKYGLITSTSDGYIDSESFQSDDKQFTDYLYPRLTSAPLEVTFPAFILKDNKTYCSNVNSLTEKDMIHGRSHLGLYEQNAANIPRTSRVKWRLAVTPVTHTIENCEDFFYKRINMLEFIDSDMAAAGFTRKDFDYDYGFATEEIRYLNETHKRPVHGKANKIYVSLTDKDADYKLDHFEILFVNGSSYDGKVIPLQRKPETDLYTGSFLPPNGYFYIQVTINTTDRIVNRLSSTAISAAEGFGESHRNPISEYKPIFKSQKVLSSPTLTTSKKDNIIIGDFIEEYFEEIVFCIAMALLVCALGCIVFVLVQYRERDDAKTQKRSDLEKAHYKAVPNTDRWSSNSKKQQNV